MPVLTCTTENPIMELGSSQTPPILNYDLPQSTSFVANVYIPVAVDTDTMPFKSEYSSPPTGNYFDVVAGLSSSVIATNIKQSFVGLNSSTIASPGSVVLPINVASKFDLGNIAVTSPPTELSATPTAVITVSGYSVDDIASQAKGARPVTSLNLNGDTVVGFHPKPAAAVPQIIIVEHHNVDTYLGDYGAGTTVKTFTLLPGEQTTISVQTFKQTVTDDKSVQNVLDSFSSTSASDLENTVQNESNITNVDSQNKVNSWNINGKLGINIPILGNILGVNVSGGTTNTTTVNSSRTTAVKALQTAVSKQAQTSANNRSVAVNTEQDVAQTESISTATVRTLQNINKSRVLNFAFRQLNQEFITVTYLNDVSFVFTNGYDETKQVAKIDGLLDMLKDVMESPTDAETLCIQILNQLANVYDVSGTNVNFIQEFTETINNVAGGSTFTSTSWRKDPSLAQTTSALPDLTFPGIILDVTSRVLPTDSVIVDAMLGQGEALDCFNIRLQESAAESAAADVDKLQLALEVIDAQDTAADKATAFHEIYKTFYWPYQNS